MKIVPSKTEQGAIGMEVQKQQEQSGRIYGEGLKFERIRRITGYLVGTTDRFNNAKRCEERDRVKHGI